MMKALIVRSFTMLRRKRVDREPTDARQPAPTHTDAHIEATAPAYDHRGRKPSSGAGSRDDLSNESLGSLMIGLSLFLPSVEGRNYPIWIGKSGFDKSKSS